MPYGVNMDLLGNLGGKPATGADLANSSFQLGNSNANTEYARQKAGQYVAQELQKEKALSEAVAPFVNNELADNYIQQAMVDNYIRRQTAAAQPEQPRQGLLGGTPQGQGYNQMSRELAQGLIQSKMIYDNGAAVFSNPDATEQQRAQAQGQMSQAQAMAASIRDTASQLGMNLDDYGSGVTLGQAQQNFQNADARALQSLLYGDGRGDNSAAKRAFQEARARGAGMADAYEMAQEAQARDRYQKLQDGFFTYGFDDNGAINHNGVRIAMEMAKTNPEMANFVMNAFPGAVQAYARDTQEKQAATKHQYDVQNMNQKANIESVLLDKKMNGQAKLAAIQAQIALEAKMAGKEMDFNFTKSRLMQAGLSEQDATAVALGMGGKSGGSKGSSGGSSGGGSSSKSSSGGGVKTSDMMSIEKNRQEWIDNHPNGEPYPHEDAYQEMRAAYNGIKEYPDDPSNYYSVQSWAQGLLEENYRDNYKYTPDQLYQAIASVGDMGKAVADEFAEQGALKAYGK